MKNDCFIYIYIHSGKSYRMSTIGHVLWAIDMLLNELKPLMDNPSLTLRDSDANAVCNISNFF